MNLPVGTKFGFYTPMFEDNPTSRKAVGDYLPFENWTNAIGMNTNVYIPNNINGAVYTKFGGTTGQFEKIVVSGAIKDTDAEQKVKALAKNYSL